MKSAPLYQELVAARTRLMSVLAEEQDAHAPTDKAAVRAAKAESCDTALHRVERAAEGYATALETYRKALESDLDLHLPPSPKANGKRGLLQSVPNWRPYPCRPRSGGMPDWREYPPAR